LASQLKKNSKISENPKDAATTNALSTSNAAPLANENIAVDTAIPPQLKQRRKPKFDPDQNHGRYAASDYTGCLRVSISHDKLKPGDCCPSCSKTSLSRRQ
jgi:hypothetical protein